jgi:hypothetical protein
MYPNNHNPYYDPRGNPNNYPVPSQEQIYQYYYQAGLTYSNIPYYTNMAPTTAQALPNHSQLTPQQMATIAPPQSLPVSVAQNGNSTSNSAAGIQSFTGNGGTPSGPENTVGEPQTQPVTASTVGTPAELDSEGPTQGALEEKDHSKDTTKVTIVDANELETKLPQSDAAKDSSSPLPSSSEIAQKDTEVPIAQSNENADTSSTPAVETVVVEITLDLEEILKKGRLMKNFYEEKVAEGMPQGWMMHVHKRPIKNGSKRHFDYYWFSPKTGKRLRSKVEVQRFLAHLETSNGDEDIAFMRLKGVNTKSLTSPKRETRKRNSKSSNGENGRSLRKRRRLSAGRTTKSSTTVSPKRKSNKPATRTRNKEAIAESKTPSRRKRVAAKKASSSPFQSRKSPRNHALPAVAESK